MGDSQADNDAIAESLHDPDAFAAIFDRHYDEIAGFLRRRLPMSAADDLAAETFLVAFRARRSFDHSRGSVRGWLYGIAWNLLRHWLRGQGRQARAMARFPVDRADDITEEIDERLDGLAEQAVLLEALEALSEEERSVLVLRAWTDLSYEEIAATLGIRVGTVRSQLARARRKARELLEAQRATNG